MDRIYSVLNEIQNGTKSPKQLFDKVQNLFKNNLVEYQIFLNDIASEAYIRFLGGNTSPIYGDIIITDKGNHYLKENTPHFIKNVFSGPCKTMGKMKCKEQFITNIDELCNTCSIRTKVANVRATLELRFETLKFINTKEYIIDHIKENIKKDNDKIEDIINSERTGGHEYRENRVSIFLSYKDCVLYWNEQLKIINGNDTQKPKVMPIDKVLTRTDYFQIISEIRNLHRETINEYITEKYAQYILKNPRFAECLYKDISKVMEGIHKEGDGDLVFENGDLVIENGDIKVTGKRYIFDDAMNFLWLRMLEHYAKNGAVLNVGNMLKNYEEAMLNNNDFSPEIDEQLKKLNMELKKEHGIIETDVPSVSKNTPPALTPTQPELKLIINKAPTFNPDYTPSILNVLKGFFPAQDANTLNKLLTNPAKNLTEPLTFNEEGNKLANAFKQLYDSTIITGCSKTELENWVLNNFNYTTRGKIQSFKKKYLNDIISTDSKPCKSPIMNVEKAEGKIYIESSLRKKKNSEQF